jgi:Ubiquitin family
VRSVKGDCVMSVSNLVGILDFKQMYLEKLGAQADGLKIENVRMFCLGKELKDELFLYSYDIQDEMTVQVMIKK